MAEPTKSNPLYAYGPLLGYGAGALLLAAFIAMPFAAGTPEAAIGKARASVVALNQKMAEQGASGMEPLVTAAPTLPAAKSIFGPATATEWKAPSPTEQSIYFPVRLNLRIRGPIGGDSPFKIADKNKNGAVEPSEYDEAVKAGIVKGAFDKRDENRDGVLNEAEFGKKVDDPIGPTPDKEAELGPPSNVRVSYSDRKFQITIKWDAPSLNPAPDDLCYIIERRCPQSLSARNVAYGKKLEEWKKAVAEWEKRKTAWEKIPDNKGKEFSEPKPVRPPKPNEWELVTDGSETPFATATEFIDTSFEAEFTYTYRVRAASKAKLKATQPLDKNFYKEYLDDGWQVSLPVEQVGAPVVMRQRIEVVRTGRSQTEDRFLLTSFAKAGNKWYRIAVPIAVPQETNVGKKMTLSALKSAKYTVLGEAGAEDAALKGEFEAALGSSSVDFTLPPGWLLLVPNQGVCELIQDKGAKRSFVIPAGTEQAVAPQDGEFDDPVEVRVLWGKDSSWHFELTRWVKAGKNWFRVVWEGDIKKGQPIGMAGKPADFTKGGATLTVYDTSGAVTDAAKAGINEISLDTGLTFEGVKGRKVSFSSGEMDLFGVFRVPGK